MSDQHQPAPSPETPWEFYPDDDLREEPKRNAEDDAMHIVATDMIDHLPPIAEEPTEVVHYLDDEDPEVPDVSVIVDTEDTQGDVEDLLIRQHYLPADE